MQNLQLLASDPKLSCWVNASAGTGKTKVLIDRILRLLLNGAKPEKILCLTFSKAAANEMQARLEAKLKSWLACDDAMLEQELFELNESNLTIAKSLFAKVSNNPVAIQTVHSFCNELLQKFSNQGAYENNFRIMEIFEEKTYLDLAFQKLLHDADEFEVLEEFISFHNENVLFDYLCRSRKSDNALNKNAVHDRLKELFDINDEPIFPIPSSVITGLIKNLLSIDFNSQENLEIYHEFAQIFLTQKGTVRKNILSKSIQVEHEDAEVILKTYGEQLADYFSQKLRYSQVQKSLGFWCLQNKFNLIYEELKQAKKLWDFNDLILETLKLFASDTFDETMLSLSYSIEHLLVDEAQDTSVQQWSIIHQIFSSLMQVQDDKRTLFVVGDAKQLIYSFQGAQISAYEKMREVFATSCPNWQEINLQTSFRSCSQILNVVDAVFENSAGLGQQQIKHVAFHAHEGVVDILPLVTPVRYEYEEWPVFIALPDENSTEDILAEQVIDYITRHNFDDIMILMRRRGRLMRALEKYAGLKSINYFASNSVNLLEKLVVQDLLSIVEFMLMPLNEVNLAALLKTDLMQKMGAVSEELLFDLCHKREKNLWLIVQEKLPDHAKFLQNVLVDNTDDAYQYFLKAYQVMEVNDYYLNQFMEEVFKRTNYLDMGIRELVEHLHRFPVQVTKTSNDNEKLKILTVHGSKGLEAKTVIVLDDADKPNLKQEVCLFDPVLGFWFLKPTQQADTILTMALKEYQQKQMEHEYERLLYVALTRAREHLIIGGVEHEPHPHSWYWRVHDVVY